MESRKEHIRRLLIEKIAETISEEDNQWIEHEISYDRDTQQLWEDISRKMHTGAARSFLQKLDADRSWESVAPQITPVRPRPAYIKWIASAAAVLAGLVAAAIYFFTSKPEPLHHSGPLAAVKNAIELHLSNGRRINLSDSANRQINLGAAKLSTGVNAMTLANDNGHARQEWSTLDVPAKLDYKVILADGTEVWLNSASRLRFPFSFPGATREVFLEGEAFFKVAADEKQPFIVHAGPTDIKVLGTSFNIQSYDRERPVTSLVDGAVAAKAAGGKGETQLKPGYQAVFDPQKGFAVQPFKAAAVLSWMQGVYYFKNTPLRDITDVLHRWFEVKVVFDDPSLADLPMTGGLEKNKPLQVFLSSLEATAGITARLQGGVLHLK